MALEHEGEKMETLSSSMLQLLSYSWARVHVVDISTPLADALKEHFSILIEETCGYQKLEPIHVKPNQVVWPRIVSGS